jgi:hypothetical protein
MTLFFRLLSALEIFLFLKRLREKQYEIATSKSKSYHFYENEVPEEHQASTDGHAQVRQKQ